MELLPERGQGRVLISINVEGIITDADEEVLFEIDTA